MSGHQRDQGQAAHGRVRSVTRPTTLAVRKLQRDVGHGRQSREALKTSTYLYAEQKRKTIYFIIFI